MSISIVIVTYNSSDKIIKLLKSLNKQRNIDRLEIIIVDNNSPDQIELKAILSKYNFPNTNLQFRLRYRKSNPGFGASCNYGASFTTNDYILFLNPDTELKTYSISTLIKHAIQNKADICGGLSLYSNTHKTHRTIFNIPKFRTMLFEFSNLGKIFGISGNFYINQKVISNDYAVEGVGGTYFLIKKSCFKELHGFDKNIFMYLEDVDICQRANIMGMKIMYCPHSVIRHIGGASSNNKHKIVYRAWYDSREYYSQKHFSKYISTVLLFLYRVERYILEFRRKINSL